MEHSGLSGRGKSEPLRAAVAVHHCQPKNRKKQPGGETQVQLDSQTGRGSQLVALESEILDIGGRAHFFFIVLQIKGLEKFFLFKKKITA